MTTFYPFSSRYISIKIEDEEHLVPRDLLKDSKRIFRALRESHDDHTIHITGIAASAFNNLMDYLLKNPHLEPLSHKEIHQIKEAAEQLELPPEVMARLLPPPTEESPG